MTVKINKLEIENVKRVKAVAIEPTINGLTVIGGNNNQGKTSVLDMKMNYNNQLSKYTLTKWKKIVDI